MNFFDPEFVKRMIVAGENLHKERQRFFSSGMSRKSLSQIDYDKVLCTTPEHERLDWARSGLTMVSWEGVLQVQRCIEWTVKEKIPGDFVETGVWRGGICILAASLYLKLDPERRVFACDSFAGLPKPDGKKYPHDDGDRHHEEEILAVPEEQVWYWLNLFDEDAAYEGFHTVKGWFRHTMPKLQKELEAISILRLDGDMYESTIDPLRYLYERLSPGGYLIIDDYGNHRPCRAAVEDFRRHRRIREPLKKLSSNKQDEIYYWRKER